MATGVDSGGASTTATSRLWAAEAEQAMALALDGGVAATAADGGVVAMVAATAVDGQRQRSMWWVLCAHLTGTPRAVHECYFLSLRWFFP